MLIDKIHNFHHFINNKAQRALAAERASIVDCIKLCKRSSATKTVLSNAVSAIIGAAWKDSGSLDVVSRIVKRLM